MPDLSPPDVDTSTTESAPVTPGSSPVAPAYNQPSVGTKILGFLSGGLHDTSYKVDPTTGQMGQVTDPNVRKPGDMFRSMLQGMLTGLAGGVDDQHRGHGGLAAFAGGAQASMAQQQQMDQQKRQAAQQQFDNGQKAQTQQYKAIQAKADFVKAQDDHAMSAFTMAREGTAMQEHEVEQANSLEQVIRTTPGAKHVAFAKDFPSLVDQLKDPQERAQMMDWRAKGELVQHPVTGKDANGNPIVLGVDFSHVPAAFLDKPTDKPVSYTENKVDPATGKSSFVKHEIPAGQLSNRDAISIQQKPMTGAITPEKTFEAEGKKDEFAHAEKMQANMIHNEWAMQGARFANEAKQAQAEGRTLSPEALPGAIDAVGTYSADENDLRFLLKSHPEALGMIKAKYPDWDQRTYAASQAALKDYTDGNGKASQAIRSGYTAISHMASLKNLIDKLPETSNIQVLNRAITSLSRQTGNPDVSSVDTLLDAVATESARNLAGKAPDADAIKDAKKTLNIDKGPRSLGAAVSTKAHVTGQAMGTYAGQFRRSVPGATTMPFGPGSNLKDAEAMHQFGIDDPFNFDQGPKPDHGGSADISQAPKFVADQFMKLANGDPKQASKLAAARGWTLPGAK